MLIRLDPVRVDGDASDVAAVTQGVLRSWNALESGLRHTAGMAGDDEGAEQWGLPYDEVAPDMNEAITSVVEVLKGFEGMLALTARTYNNVELYGAGHGDNASGIDLPAELTFYPNDIPTCIGVGAHGFLGDMQEVLEGALASIGVTFPRGDTDKLRSAVNPWLTFAQDMTTARTQLSSALGGVQSAELSHKRSITLAANDLDQILKDLALCAVGMAGELNTIATNIDQTWHELQTMAWNLAIEIAIEIGIGVALSFVTFGAGAAAAAIVVSVRVAAWAVHASAVIRRLAAILRICGNRLQDFHSILVKFRTGGFFWRAGYQAGSSSIAAIGGSFLADHVMGNEISSEQAWAYVLGGLAGGVAGGAAGAGISMLSKLPNNVGVAMVGGAVEGMAEGVVGGLTASTMLGQQFNLGQSLLTGAIGGAAVGGIGHGIETKFGTGTGSGTGTGAPTVGNVDVNINTPDTNVQLELDTTGTGGSGTPDVGGTGAGTGGTGGVPTGGGTSTAGDIANVDLSGVTSTTQLDGLPTTETSTPTTETDGTTTTAESDGTTTPTSETDGTTTNADSEGSPESDGASDVHTDIDPVTGPAAPDAHVDQPTPDPADGATSEITPDQPQSPTSEAPALDPTILEGPDFQSGTRWFGADQFHHYFQTDSTGAVLVDADGNPLWKPGVTLGGNGVPFFMSPTVDMAGITTPLDAAIQSGLAPSADAAHLNGWEMYGIEVPLDGVPVRLPTLTDAGLGTPEGVFDHFFPGGHTAVRVGDEWIINPTREFVLTGGIPLPPGSTIFRLLGDGTREIIAIFN